MKDFLLGGIFALAALLVLSVPGKIDLAVAELDHAPVSAVWTQRNGIPDDGIERIDDVRYAWLVVEPVCQ